MQEGWFAMNYRRLGKTGLMVSEIGFGGEWLERHEEEESVRLLQYASEKGINIVDCWMPDPKSRDIIGKAMLKCQNHWIVQGHIGSTYQNEQYVRTRDLKYVKPAFEDLLARLHTNAIDLGMIHFVDSREEWDSLQQSDYLTYVKQLKSEGKIHHIGLSTHNSDIASLAAKSGYVEMILFSINPAFDLLPPDENMDDLFSNDTYNEKICGIAPERTALYNLCKENDVGLTVMKPFAGGRLLSAENSPLNVKLTVNQCIHYALTRPAVASVLCGYDTAEQVDEAVAYETAADEQKDYVKTLASAAHLANSRKCMYCNHCKPCPADIDIAMVNKLYDLAMIQTEVPLILKEHYQALAHHADECIACGSCETRCPFHVDIVKRMQLAKECFKA